MASARPRHLLLARDHCRSLEVSGDRVAGFASSGLRRPHSGLAPRNAAHRALRADRGHHAAQFRRADASRSPRTAFQAGTDRRRRSATHSGNWGGSHPCRPVSPARWSRGSRAPGLGFAFEPDRRVHPDAIELGGCPCACTAGGAGRIADGNTTAVASFTSRTTPTTGSGTNSRGSRACGPLLSRRASGHRVRRRQPSRSNGRRQPPAEPADERRLHGASLHRVRHLQPTGHDRPAGQRSGCSLRQTTSKGAALKIEL